MCVCTDDRELLHFEDFVPGRVFELGERTLTETEIVAFAEAWDPQAFHLGGGLEDLGGGLEAFHLGGGPEAAHDRPAGPIASGWHVACVWMRLYVDAVLSRAAMLTAPGLEELRWRKPVLPGMQLRGRATVLHARRSQRSPRRGSLSVRGELLDDGGEPVMTMIGWGRARLRRPEGGQAR